MAVLRANIVFTFRILIRIPGFWVPTIVFPAMLYAFFGAANAADGPDAVYAVASFCVYAVLGVAFYQFSVSIAEDRKSAFSVWQSTLPAGPVPFWTARLCGALAFSIAAVLLVFVTAWLVAGLRLELATQIRLLAVCIIVGVPATFMGTTLGYLAGNRSAAAVANLVFLPLAYLGGLWVPPPALPAQINTISQWTPTRHMGEVAWATVDGRVPPIESVAALCAFTIGFVALTWFAHRSDRLARLS